MALQRRGQDGKGPRSYGVTQAFLQKPKVRGPWQASCYDTGARASLGQKEGDILTGQMWAGFLG